VVEQWIERKTERLGESFCDEVCIHRGLTLEPTPIHFTAMSIEWHSLESLLTHQGELLPLISRSLSVATHSTLAHLILQSSSSPILHIDRQ